MNAATAIGRNGAVSARRLLRAEIEQACGETILAADQLDFIEGVTTPDRLLPHRLLFVERDAPALVQELATDPATSMLIIATEQYKNVVAQPRIITDKPRLVFAQIVSILFGDQFIAQTQALHPSAEIHPTARLSIGVTIGPRSRVGAHTVIYPNVTVGPNVAIGAYCVVRSGTVLGQSGFGIYRDRENNPQVLPHVAGVAIGDNVALGALNTVASGTIHPTVVEDWVKTDDHVHIAHNCFVGARTIITACAELSGSVVIGRDCWIGPNASIRDGISVGDGAFVGIASNVVRPVEAGTTVFGNPARLKK